MEMKANQNEAKAILKWNSAMYNKKKRRVQLSKFFYKWKFLIINSQKTKNEKIIYKNTEAKTTTTSIMFKKEFNLTKEIQHLQNEFLKLQKEQTELEYETNKTKQLLAKQQKLSHFQTFNQNLY